MRNNLDLNKLSFRERILQNYPDLDPIPKGYKRIENKIILRHNQKLSKVLGEAIMVSYSWCTGVFQQLQTIGENRRPELLHLAGGEDTIVTHLENQTRYMLDISKITFSGGNSELRRRMVRDVMDGENILDMFAAVGNLSLQILKHRKTNGILIEKDPYTFSFLQKSVDLNSLTNIEIHNADCRDIIIENWADRVLMGYHEVNESHMLRALEACKEIATIHLHPLAHKNNYEIPLQKFQMWIKEAGPKITNTTTRKIKSYSPNLDHIEIVVSIEK